MTHRNLLADALPGADFIWRDIRWVDRSPVLKVEPLLDGKPLGEVHSIPLSHRDFLGFRLLGDDSPHAGRYCTGYAVARPDGPGFSQTPCPTSERITKGKQCDRCLARDEFAPIHRVHTGAHMNDAALAYVNLEHYLYVATFPDGTSKVGTASLHSNPRRLDEQAVAAATFIAKAQNGRVVRVLEDAVSTGANLTQFKRASTKFRAWTAPATTEQLKSEHYSAVERATWELEDLLDDGLEGFKITDTRWEHSPAMNRAYAALRADNSRPLTAYDRPAQGNHGFLVSGGTGKFLTAHCGDETADFLVNTTDFTNYACTLHHQLVAPSSAQASLF